MSKALVLSGGGPLANAWECGLVAGLAQSGLALRAADFFLGTSAGAIVGAQLATGRDPIAMAEAILTEPPRAPAGRPNAVLPAAAIAKLPELFGKSQIGEAGRMEVGAYALAAATPDDVGTYIRRTSAIVGAEEWPETVGLVVVDVADGTSRVLRWDCGATLGTGVAASCCLPGLHPVVPISGRHYMDGGLRSAANADLVGHFDTILVLSFNLPGPVGQKMISRVTAQADGLSAAGMRVLVVTPDEECLAAIGPQSMNFARRPEVVRQAMKQGASISDRLARFWQ